MELGALELAEHDLQQQQQCREDAKVTDLVQMLVLLHCSCVQGQDGDCFVGVMSSVSSSRIRQA